MRKEIKDAIDNAFNDYIRPLLEENEAIIIVASLLAEEDDCYNISTTTTGRATPASAIMLLDAISRDANPRPLATIADSIQTKLKELQRETK